MKSIFEFLPEIAKSEESPLVDVNSTIGWHVVLFDKEMNALGGGFSSDKTTARRIAIAEMAERKLFRQLLNSDDANRFRLGSHPCTCGFAAGFEKEKTRLRALAEAVERWAWSKWIDEGFKINEISIDTGKLTKNGQLIIENFDHVKFFSLKIDTSSIINFVPFVELNIILGFKDGGVFPGSRVISFSEEKWEHGIVEAWRHLEIFRKYRGSISIPFPYGRIFYFGKNSNEALKQIESAQKLIWPKPKELILQEMQTGVTDLYFWRALMEDYLSWHEGNEKRFVY